MKIILPLVVMLLLVACQKSETTNNYYTMPSEASFITDTNNDGFLSLDEVETQVIAKYGTPEYSWLADQGYKSHWSEYHYPSKGILIYSVVWEGEVKENELYNFTPIEIKIDTVSGDRQWCTLVYSVCNNLLSDYIEYFKEDEDPYDEMFRYYPFDNVYYRSDNTLITYHLYNGSGSEYYITYVKSGEYWRRYKIEQYPPLYYGG